MRRRLLAGAAVLAFLAYPLTTRATGIPVVDAALVAIKQNEFVQEMIVWVLSATHARSGAISAR
jgi:hypothetical protein